jgi:hypothetical protein
VFALGVIGTIFRGNEMRKWFEIMLDEKIVLGSMMVVCLITVLVLVKWNTDKDLIMSILTLAGGFGGALTRGITHQPQQTDSTQTVASTTTVTPKE